MLPVTSSTSSLKVPTILCSYLNSTNKVQLIRVWNGRNYSLEKIIFPQERILFEATSVGILEIHAKRKGRQLLEDIFSCSNLQVNQLQPQLSAI